MKLALRFIIVLVVTNSWTLASIQIRQFNYKMAKGVSIAGTSYNTYTGIYFSALTIKDKLNFNKNS